MRKISARSGQPLLATATLAFVLARTAPAAPPSGPAPSGPTPPDSGILLDTVKPVPALPAKPPGKLVTAEPESRPALSAVPGLRVHLTSVRFSGVTAVPLADLQALARPSLGKDVTFAELDAIAGRVTKLYRDRGFFIARAYLPQQELTDGSVEILVLEGHLGEVHVKYATAGPSVSNAVLASFVKDAIPAQKPVTVRELERAMLLANDLPNLIAHATLVPGQSVGTSDLIMEVDQKGWFSHDTIEADNAGSRYSGTYRFGGSANLVSPAGIGDLLSGRILSSFDGFNYGRLGWTTPVTGTGLKLGVSETYTNYRLGGALSPLDDHGAANVASVFSVYPIVRARTFNLYQTVTLEARALHDESVAGELADKRIKAGTLGLNGDETDTLNGAGLSTFAASVEFGHLSLSSGAADVAADAETAQAAGNYRKVTLQASRQQRLVDNVVLYGSLNAQFASKNLDSSESLSFGGPGGVRAYPVGEAPADAGVVATLELRYNIPAQTPLGAVQALLFVDHGSVKLHEDPWTSYIASGARDTYALNAAGLGLNLYREDSLLVTATAAHKIGTNPDPGLHGVDADGRDSSTRFWVQVVKYW
jgi:hemolysin activation/secretion protein